MNEIANSNIPSLSVQKMTQTLSELYLSASRMGIKAKDIPSVMLWGPPGVGKSQGVREIARLLEEGTGKHVNVTDVRLLLFNPIDLRGIPTANADKTLAIWLRPRIFQMDASDNVINILFLDELSAAPQTVQAAAYQITLDRVVGEHRLPENCIVIAAGNRITDKSVAVKMPKALANRLMHFDIQGSFESWQNWAVSHGISKKVLGYLSNNRNRLFGFDPNSDDLAFATPRSWEMVSNILKTNGDDPMKCRVLISALVGNATALEFCSWVNVFDEIPQTEAIFNGTEKRIPKGTDQLYATVYSMTEYAREHCGNKTAIGHSIDYARRLPYDFTTLLLFNYANLNDSSMEKTLRTIPEYLDLVSRRASLNNGSV